MQKLSLKLQDCENHYTFKKEHSLAQLMSKVVANKGRYRKHITVNNELVINRHSGDTWYITDTQWNTLAENLPSSEVETVLNSLLKVGV